MIETHQSHHIRDPFGLLDSNRDSNLQLWEEVKQKDGWTSCCRQWHLKLVIDTINSLEKTWRTYLLHLNKSNSDMFVAHIQMNNIIFSGIF